MRSFISLICVILICNMGYSQRGSVSGVVQDELQGTPIAHAGVMLLHATDSLLIKGAITEQDGSFEIEGIPNGNYLLKIALIGYEEWFSPPYTISSEKSKVQMDIIKLKISVAALNAAEIIYKKPLFEEKQGTMIMNVESQPNAAGDNVLELLRKMPSVTVDQNDNISVLGKSGILIMIDDKPTYLSGDDLTNLLKTMPASSIDKIEVIKNPSARYDAAGTGGIINIVTKKDQNRGINGSVFAAGGYSGSFQHNEGFNITARLGKIVLSGSYYYMNFKGKSGGKSEEISTLGDVTTRIVSNEKDNEFWCDSSNWQSHGYSFGADYYIDDKNTIGFSYRGNYSLAHWSSNAFVRIYKNPLPDSSYRRFSTNIYSSTNHTFNLDFKHEFDTTGKTLYTNVIYALNGGKTLTESDLNFYQGDFASLSSAYLLKSLSGPNKMQVLTAQIDYEHPIGDAIKFELGIKSSYVYNRNQSENYINTTLIEAQSNKFQYRENINAAYIQLNLSPSSMVDIQTGLRAEYSLLEGLLFTTGEKNRQRYFDLFPSFELSYHLPKSHNLGFSYRNRIYRPDYSVLNPYISVTDQYNISTGNPKLKPEYSHHLEVNYSWKYMIYTSLSYNFSQGEYTDVQYTDLMTLTRLTRPENIGRSSTLGGSVYARIPIGKWWVMSYSINGNYGTNVFDYGNKTERKTIYSTQFYTSQLFSFLKNYSVELSAWGLAPSENTFGRSEGLFSVNAALKADLIKRTLTVKVSVNDIFNNGKWIENNIYPDGSESKGEWRWESRRLWVHISYRFGKQDLQLRQKRMENQEELQRMEGQPKQEGKGNVQQ